MNRINQLDSLSEIRESTDLCVARYSLAILRWVGVFLVSGACLTAQNANSIFRSDVRLKEVSVIASSKDGPVEDLTKDDFEIFEDGKRQETPRDQAVFLTKTIGSADFQVACLQASLRR
jgi:hypothetical protein